MSWIPVESKVQQLESGPASLSAGGEVGDDKDIVIANLQRQLLEQHTAATKIHNDDLMLIQKLQNGLHELQK
jgi:hypothetical protein